MTTITKICRSIVSIDFISLMLHRAENNPPDNIDIYETGLVNKTKTVELVRLQTEHNNMNINSTWMTSCLELSLDEFKGNITINQVQFVSTRKPLYWDTYFGITSVVIMISLSSWKKRKLMNNKSIKEVKGRYIEVV